MTSQKFKSENHWQNFFKKLNKERFPTSQDNFENTNCDLYLGKQDELGIIFQNKSDRIPHTYSSSIFYLVHKNGSREDVYLAHSFIVGHFSKKLQDCGYFNLLFIFQKLLK